MILSDTPDILFTSLLIYGETQEKIVDYYLQHKFMFLGVFVRWFVYFSDFVIIFYVGRA